MRRAGYPASMLTTMDIEGVDIAVMYGTRRPADPMPRPYRRTGSWPLLPAARRPSAARPKLQSYLVRLRDRSAAAAVRVILFEDFLSPYCEAAERV